MNVWETFPDDEMLPYERVGEYLGVEPGSVRMLQRIGVLEFAYGCAQWMIDKIGRDHFVEEYGDARRAATILDPRRNRLADAPKRRSSDS
jgi:hypothetical protein